MTDWSAVGRKSCRKGKVHEREIARVLRRATGCEWGRTKNSGRTDLGGDVWSPAGFCPFVMVECKHRVEFETTAMVQGNAAYLNEMTKVVLDWGGRPAYSTLVVLVKNSLGLWVMAYTRDKKTFAASRPAVLLRCAGRWTWSYAGRGEDTQAGSPVITELFRWVVANGQGCDGAAGGVGPAVGGAYAPLPGGGLPPALAGPR